MADGLVPLKKTENLRLFLFAVISYYKQPLSGACIETGTTTLYVCISLKFIVAETVLIEAVLSIHCQLLKRWNTV
jgi:hypothetical protein